MTRRDDLEAVLTHVADPSELLLVLDFDGTLSPIVDDPDAAAPADGAIAAVAALADRAVVAIVSGRHLDDLVPRVGELPVTLVGGHGTEVRDPDGTRTSLFDDGPVQHVLDTCEAELTDLLADVGGWRVERKPASLAVHHRTAVPADVERLLPRVRAVLAAPAADGPFDVLDGKAVTELRPSGVDKGRALRWLARRHPDRRVLVVGDDVTDEDAFEAADDLGGQAVLVSDSPRATAARWRIDDPVRVVWLLERLGAPGAVAPLGAEEVWTRRFHPIGEHGMIGDSRTAALVAPDASVEWMCVPRFDSPSVFAAILDPLRGGRFRVRPTRPLEVQRTYLGETNVVVTRFVDAGSPVLTVTDLLVTSRVAAFDPDHTGHVLLRRVEAFEDVEVEVEFQPRFDYARVPTRLERADGCVVATAETSDGPERAVLETDLPLEVVEHEDGNGDVARVRTTLAGGDTRWLTLRTGAWERSPHLHLSSEELLDLTVRTWGRWARAIDYDGPWREDVVRSALVLKGLVYEPTGALVAAPTTSLPEGLGGVRNWDYRYAWLRDAAIVMSSLLRAGYREEARAWREWLLRAVAGDPENLQIMYGIAGERQLPESELEWLSGYEGSAPVRIGNAAASQRQ
ncbi:MAG: trehalose-phosphatase, partial [Actinomycetes bacterium]